MEPLAHRIALMKSVDVSNRIACIEFPNSFSLQEVLGKAG